MGTVAAELRYHTHWLGPTDGAIPAQSTAACLAVASDGTCFVGSMTDTGVPEVVMYRDGMSIGRCAPLPGAVDGGGTAVAVSDRHLYVAVAIADRGQNAPGSGVAPPDGPPAGTTWHGLWRFTHGGQHAPFPGGRAVEQALLVVQASPAATDAASSLSPVIAGVWSHEGELFVSETTTQQIRVYDEMTLTVKRSFRADQPGALCVLAGTVQVVERGAVVTAYSLDGRPTGQRLDEGTDLLPGSLASTPEGRLMISDRGPGQHIHFFNMSGVPTRVRTLGEENGMYGPPTPGEAGPRRFARVTGVGADTRGNLYVAMNPPPAGFALRSFNPDRKSLRWQVLVLDTSDGADGDPRSDGVDIYTAEGRHALDLTKPPGESWRWVAQTVNPFRYPHDPRLATRSGAFQAPSANGRAHSPFEGPGPAPSGPDPKPGATTTFRELNGKKFLALRSPDGLQLSLYRLEGHTAAPTMVFNNTDSPEPSAHSADRPNSNPWIWRDANGDGHQQAAEITTLPAGHGRFAASPMDDRGGLWCVSADNRIHHWPCRGFDVRGLPLYDPDPASSTRAPAGLTEPLGLHYDAPTDVLYLAGIVKSSEGPTITHLLRLDAWSAHAAAAQSRWHARLPIAPLHANPSSLCAAGELVFALDPATAQVHVLEAQRGTALGRLEVSTEKFPNSSLTPTAAIRAHRRKDGTYLIFAQDPHTRQAVVYHLEDPLGRPPSK